MKRSTNVRRALVLLGALAITAAFTACAGESEHDEGGEAGEESGIQYALGQTYDKTRAGARLVLGYDAGTNRFVGTVENTTETILRSVRVEVHLSNGVELGPTIPTDLDPGETLPIGLSATEAPFETYSAHPEVGGSESGEGGEHGG